MPDDDAPDDGAYPPAPLPAHERTWRHPSEMGEAMWTHTEPPITIGRGLLITTGAIGGLLSIAVLWAMLPSAGRGGTAAPTVVASTANDLQSTRHHGPARHVGCHVGRRAPALHHGPHRIDRCRDLRHHHLDIDRAGTAGFQRGQPRVPHWSSPTPVAVGVGDSLVITTARAVRGRTTITLTGADGQPHEADGADGRSRTRARCPLGRCRWFHHVVRNRSGRQPRRRRHRHGLDADVGKRRREGRRPSHPRLVERLDS